MPEGPMGAPRPGAKVKLVVMVITEESVGIDDNPLLIEKINGSLRDPDIGPGFEAGTIEKLEGGASEGLFSNFFGGSGMNPVKLSGSKGVYMTFALPSLTEDQLYEIEAAVQHGTGVETEGFTVGCI